MRSHEGDDGRKRIMAKVYVPITVEDIAKYALRHLCDVKDPVAKIESANKRVIFDYAKRTLYEHGAITPIDHIENEFEPIVLEKVISIVKDKFPELD